MSSPNNRPKHRNIPDNSNMTEEVRHLKGKALIRRLKEAKRSLISTALHTASVCEDAGALRAALASYDTVLAVDASRVIAHLGRGAILMRQGAWAGSVAAFEAASCLDPADALPHIYLGQIFDPHLRLGLYGFRPPVAELLGFGKSIHDCSDEIHRRAMAGDLVSEQDIPPIVNRHLHLPYASKKDKERLRAVAARVMANYVRRYGPAIRQVVLTEKPVEIRAEGLTLQGRVDHLKRLDTVEESVVEKTAEDAQVYDATRGQLLLGALGLRALRGRTPDLMETHQMQPDGSRTREVIGAGMLDAAERAAFAAGRAIRDGRLGRLPVFCARTRAKCDHQGQCGTWHERTPGEGQVPAT